MNLLNKHIDDFLVDNYHQEVNTDIGVHVSDNMLMNGDTLKWKRFRMREVTLANGNKTYCMDVLLAVEDKNLLPFFELMKEALSLFAYSPNPYYSLRWMKYDIDNDLKDIHCEYQYFDTIDLAEDAAYRHIRDIKEKYGKLEVSNNITNVLGNPNDKRKTKKV